MRKALSLVLVLFLAACGSGGEKQSDLEKRIAALESTSSALSAMVYSDFATCTGADTSDPLINKMCQVAQAATVEARVQLKGELMLYLNSIQSQIDVVNANLSSHQANLDLVTSQVDSISTSLSSLDTRLTSAESAISALQTLTASISSSLNGTMVSIDIGVENAGAGPIYESVLRRFDKKRFTGYVSAYSSTISLGNKPISATNGSSTVTVTTPSAHGYSVGDRVEFQDLVGGRGFSNGHVFGQFIILTVPTSTTLTISLNTSATSSGSLGGSTGLLRKVIGQGMSSLWSAGDPSDSAVRVTNLGSKRYNFIIRRKASDVTNQTAELCYSNSSNTATFATINAAAEGGAGAIVCK